MSISHERNARTIERLQKVLRHFYNDIIVFYPCSRFWLKTEMPLIENYNWSSFEFLTVQCEQKLSTLLMVKTTIVLTTIGVDNTLKLLKRDHIQITLSWVIYNEKGQTYVLHTDIVLTNDLKVYKGYEKKLCKTRK